MRYECDRLAPVTEVLATLPLQQPAKNSKAFNISQSRADGLDTMDGQDVMDMIDVKNGKNGMDGLDRMDGIERIDGMNKMDWNDGRMGRKDG